MAYVVVSKIVDGVETIISEYDTLASETQVEQKEDDNSKATTEVKDRTKARKSTKSK